MADLAPQYRHLSDPKQFRDFLNGQGALANRNALAAEHDYDYRARKLTFEQHFHALVLLHATNYKSARDLVWAAEHDKLFAANASAFDISVPGFTCANKDRPLAPFLAMLQQVMHAVAELPHRRLRNVKKQTWQEIVGLLSRVDIFDATKLHLPPSLANWAQCQEAAETSFKLHLKLDDAQGYFKQVLLTPAQGNDSPYFSELLNLQQGAGRINLFDCGYFKVAQYHKITDSGNYFVTKLHGNIKPEKVAERPVPEGPLPACQGADGYQVLSDQYVLLNGDERNWYRCLHVQLSTDEQVTILTNLLWLSAEQICLLYRYRWSIEIVFRWLKSLLQLDHFISRDPQGLLRQVVTALIVWGLLVIANQDGGAFSPKQLWRELQAALHEAIFEYGRKVGWQEVMAGQCIV
jgi:IS4 transposase